MPLFVLHFPTILHRYMIYACRTVEKARERERERERKKIYIHCYILYI